MTEPHNPPQDDALPEPVKRRRTAILVLTASLLVVIGASFYYVNRPKDYIVIPTCNGSRQFNCRDPRGQDIFINKNGEIKLKTQIFILLPSRIRYFIRDLSFRFNIIECCHRLFPDIYRNDEIINKHGRIELLGKSLSQTEFKEFVRNILTLYGTDVPFRIFADENAEYHDIQPVLRLLKDEGVGGPWMAVQNEYHNRSFIRIEILDIDIDPGKFQLFITVE